MKVSFASSSAKASKADIFFAGYFEKGDMPTALKQQEPRFVELLKTALKSARFQGRFGEVFSSYSTDNKNAPEIVLIGLGQEKNYKIACVRKAAGQVVRILRERNLKNARLLADSFSSSEVSITDAAYAIAEISHLAAYQFDKYKTKNGKAIPKAPETAIQIVSGRADASVQKAVQQAGLVAEAVNFTRNLINEPANILNPKTLSIAARQMASANKLKCTVLEEAQLRRLNMGGLIGVGQGSSTPPALIILEYGKQYAGKGTLCIVGKGVTFDTGGISIKGAKGMEKMKYDMSGAAAVIGTMKALAGLKLKAHVVALAPTAENNVSEDPTRPGDIIRMHNGKTVEVINTDAEGRLILGDALAYSQVYKPKAIIDLATLTGMCAATFAEQAIGLMSNDEKLTERVKESGARTGERCWELPMWDEYFDQIKGSHSDLKNTGGPYGGTITAAMFLKEFVPANTPWVHLDIAGTAWCESPRYDSAVGGTGVGVRLLIDFISYWV